VEIENDGLRYCISALLRRYTLIPALYRGRSDDADRARRVQTDGTIAENQKKYNIIQLYNLIAPARPTRRHPNTIIL